MIAVGEKFFSRNIHLRLVTLEDVNERYLGWMQDETVNKFMETRHRKHEIVDIKNFVRQVSENKTEFLFAICDNKTGSHIGNIKLGPVKPYHSIADVSLFIGEECCRGRGYATEAIKLVSSIATNRLGLTKLAASAYEINKGSIKSFQNAGFEIEGHRIKHYLLDGVPSNLVELGLVLE